MLQSRLFVRGAMKVEVGAVMAYLRIGPMRAPIRLLLRDAADLARVLFQALAFVRETKPSTPVVRAQGFELLLWRELALARGRLQRAEPCTQEHVAALEDEALACEGLLVLGFDADGRPLHTTP